MKEAGDWDVRKYCKTAQTSHNRSVYVAPPDGGEGAMRCLVPGDHA